MRDSLLFVALNKGQEQVIECLIMEVLVMSSLHSSRLPPLPLPITFLDPILPCYMLPRTSHNKVHADAPAEAVEGHPRQVHRGRRGIGISCPC